MKFPNCWSIFAINESDVSRIHVRDLIILYDMYMQIILRNVFSAIIPTAMRKGILNADDRGSH